jgi:hypothetical protein
VIVAGDPSGSPSDSPANRVDANTTISPYAGVGSLARFGGFVGTATPISPTHVITAGHLLDNDGNGTVDFAPGNVSFRLNYGGDLTHEITASALSIHPNYTGFNNPNVHDDIAIVTLSSPLPSGVPIYPLLTTPLSPNTTLTFVGYGSSGNGIDGYTVGSSATIKRVGLNAADSFLVDDEGGGQNEVFVFDFDGPDSSTNFRGGLTLGNDLETTFGSGDSGGPAFYDDGGTLRLAGVNTFVGRFIIDPNGPVLGPAAPFFGSAGGGMLVPAYQSYIGNVTGIPEAGAFASMSVVVLGSGTVVWVRARLKRQSH